jgi:hypothetical protein
VKGLAADFRAPTILRAAALILFSSAVMVQPTDTKSPRSEFTDGQDARLRAFQESGKHFV